MRPGLAPPPRPPRPDSSSSALGLPPPPRPPRPDSSSSALALAPPPRPPRPDSSSSALALTPAQTVGPYHSIGLDWGEAGRCAFDPASPYAIRVYGRVLDGQGTAVGDALIEMWQVQPDGFARCLTTPDGGWEVVTVKPEAVPTPGGAAQAPHLDVSIFARGLLHGVVTRLYFADEVELNVADPVLGALDDEARSTLLAAPDGPGRYRFDVHLSGPGETVFFRA